jgi:type I restriction enzyme S subunit
MTAPKHWEIFPLNVLVDVLDNLRVPVNSSERSKRPGLVPYYGATGQVGTIDKAIFNEELLVLGEDGVQFFDQNKPKAYKISGPAWVNNHAHVLRPKQDRVLQNFLLHFLNQFNYVGYANGTTRLKLTQGAMNSIPVPLPSIDEQHKIVDLLEDHLSRLDAALVDVKQAKIKAAQFRRSLLKAGLSGFFSTGPRDETTGLPRTWRLRTLADVADWTSGGTPSSKDSALYGGDIPWIVIGDLTEGVVLETEKMITQKGLDSSSAKKLPAGSILLAMYGASIGRTGVMGKEMATNQAIACGVPKDEAILGQYLLYFLQSQKNEFIAAGKGGAQPNISQGVVKSWQIPLPPKDEQLQIIIEIESQLEHLSQANKATETLLKESMGLRRSLLQAAFTGQLTKEVINV